MLYQHECEVPLHVGYTLLLHHLVSLHPSWDHSLYNKMKKGEINPTLKSEHEHGTHLQMAI